MSNGARPPTADEKIWIATRSAIDPQASLTRIEETAKHLFTSVGIFATLFSGLGMLTELKLPAAQPWYLWLPLVFVTISLFAAALALTPRVNLIQVNDLDAVADAFRRRIESGGNLVAIAGLSFALAIPAALPVAMLLSQPAETPAATLTVHPSLRVTHKPDGTHSLAVAVDLSKVPQGVTSTAEVRGFTATQSSLLMRHSGTATADGTISASADLENLAYERYELNVATAQGERKLGAEKRFEILVGETPTR